MSNEFTTIEAEPGSEHGTFTSYVLGFILSLGLTLTSYLLVTKNVLTDWVLIFTIVGLGILQMMIQLLFFLHLGHEARPRWNLLAFLFMIVVIVILVIGSLWIMYNLDDRVMPKANMDLMHQKGF